jgi:hypothetical protein
MDTLQFNDSRWLEIQTWNGKRYICLAADVVIFFKALNGFNSNFPNLKVVLFSYTERLSLSN